jgi:inosine-uridine nucleoside N-ribohydrolase
MTRKILIVADPGIDSAFAISLAVTDPDLEVVGLAAAAGNVPADRATCSLHALVEYLDPPRWPRTGAALPVEYERYATDLHGPDGLGGLSFPEVHLHHPTPSDRLIADLAREHAGELTLVVMGPLTVVARALDRDPDLPRELSGMVIVGGARHGPGDASAVAEFHFWCDPEAARQVLHCGTPTTLIPLDVSHKLILSPGDIGALPPAETRVGQLLRKAVQGGLAATAGLCGIEGVYLCDVLGLAAVTCPTALTLKAVPVDVETRGQLTRGMSVFDTRWATRARPNVDLVMEVDLNQVRQYMQARLDALAR